MSRQETITQEELEKISGFARKKMNGDEIYTFSLILCDNEIDRDNEKFTVDSLNTLAKLFVGKTGIFDHNMRSKDQSARIYETEVVTDSARKTSDGENYTYVKAKAYMVRTDSNKDLIAEIDAGIKKETSVGCCVRSIRCSICGKDIKTEGCEHRKGAVYGNKVCSYHLCEPEDAYEWSFVAVPAQRNAGVVKSYNSGSEKSYESEYRNELEADIVKYAAGVMPGFSSELLGRICNSLEAANLREMRDAFAKEAEKKFTPVRQLDVSAYAEETDMNEKYKI